MARHESLSFITDEQEANLRKLAAYLLTLPEDYPDFEMRSFTADKSSPDTVSCGTAACAVGHGPAAGIAPLIEDDADWWRYSVRAFIGGWSLPEWGWCFDSHWSSVDNTVHGAAKRILFLLKEGLPEDFREVEDPEDYERFPSLYTDMVLA